MITCLLIYFIGKARSLSTETMVLAGIAILFLFHSALALLQYLASEEELQAVVFWLFGSLTKVTWPTAQETRGATVVVIVTVFIMALFLGLFDLFWSSIMDLLYPKVG